MGDTVPLRKSKRQDYSVAAERIDDHTDIDPWSVDQVADLVLASRRVHGIPLVTDGRTPVVPVSELVEWFRNRIMQTTVALRWEDYEAALGMGLYDILVSELDPTDMGNIRQRSLAQHLENALTGYLAEVAVAVFLEARDIGKVHLDLGRSGTVDEMVGSDISRIEVGSEERAPNLDIQIKKSKPRSSWLPIPGKGDEPPDVYLLSRVGPRYEHLLQYLDSLDLDVLERMTASLSPDRRTAILDQIPDPSPIPVHVTGFISWAELASGTLRIETKRKHAHIEGGYGRVPETIEGYGRPRVVGLDDPSEDYLAAVSALRYRSEEWTDLIEQL